MTPRASTTTDHPSLGIQHPEDYPDTNTEPPSPTVDEDRLAPTGRVAETDWDFQWPFYGEGLQDTNLDWTLDFLSSGISTHSPLDNIHDGRGIMQPIEMGNLGLTQVPDTGPNHPVDNNTQENFQSWPDEGSGARSPRNQWRTCKTPDRDICIDVHRRDSFVENAEILHSKSQISEEVHQAMMETVTEPLLESFCGEKGNSYHCFPPISTIIHFVNLFFIHVQPRFPVLHIPTFRSSECSSHLLLAMAIIGSSYSDPSQNKFALIYLERTRMSMKLMQEKDQKFVRQSWFLDQRSKLTALFCLVTII